MEIGRHLLASPYWARPDENEPWPGSDFTRELAAPGTNATFPEGAVGIYIDDDFWCVAALPWAWREVPLAELVGTLWPTRVPTAEFMPDHESVD